MRDDAETETEIGALESKFFTALERGDSVAITECYASDIRVWSNLQQAELTGPEHIAGLEAHFFNSFLDRKYIEPRTDRIADGFVRQHILTGSRDGEPVHMPICTICRISNGRLIRIEEYLTFPPPQPS